MGAPACVCGCLGASVGAWGAFGGVSEHLEFLRRLGFLVWLRRGITSATRPSRHVKRDNLRRTARNKVGRQNTLIKPEARPALNFGTTDVWRAHWRRLRRLRRSQDGVVVHSAAWCDEVRRSRLHTMPILPLLRRLSFRCGRPAPLLFGNCNIAGGGGQFPNPVRCPVAARRRLAG